MAPFPFDVDRLKLADILKVGGFVGNDGTIPLELNQGWRI
jgi:hypothetical protein